MISAFRSHLGSGGGLSGDHSGAAQVGAYIAPPSVEVTSVTGEVVIDGSHSLASLHEDKLVVGQRIETKLGAQALIVLDDANSIRLAEETSIKLREPRKKVRQVIDVTAGEIWGKFVSSGHAFAIGFEPSEDKRFEITGDQGAEFDLAVGEMAQHVLPDNLPESTDASSATAVLRVFRGVVLTGQVGNTNEKFQPVGRDLWVVYFDDGQSFSGRRGDEDFRHFALRRRQPLQRPAALVEYKKLPTTQPEQPA